MTQGYLDRQYTQLEALAKDTNPNFIVEIITLYFRDSPNVIASLEHELEREPIEVPMITRCILRLESSSARLVIIFFIGAIKVVKELKKANTFLKAGNIEGNRHLDFLYSWWLP
ncbi:hypothetical protein AXX17_AT5G19630 [Arabidopsis thaliana]|uniref:Histidine-containing phosphotransfer protein n=1 Tax=Arabidopsis thaliana TaxID=3702 RepID=A0A178ULH1_ARATH|nr:hypothetical protein AXX17_AT5G19630 [Arabidopsis thaliana]